MLLQVREVESSNLSTPTFFHQMRPEALKNDFCKEVVFCFPIIGNRRLTVRAMNG